MQSVIFVAVAAAALGVEVGWQPADSGGLEYLIQIEPELLDQLKTPGQEISVGIPPELRDIRRYRVFAGRGDLPRINLPPSAVGQASGVDGGGPNTASLAAPTLNQPQQFQPDPAPGALATAGQYSAAQYTSPEPTPIPRMEDPWAAPRPLADPPWRLETNPLLLSPWDDPRFAAGSPTAPSLHQTNTSGSLGTTNPTFSTPNSTGFQTPPTASGQFNDLSTAPAWNGAAPAPGQPSQTTPPGMTPINPPPSNAWAQQQPGYQQQPAPQQPQYFYDPQGRPYYVDQQGQAVYVAQNAPQPGLGGDRHVDLNQNPPAGGYLNPAYPQNGYPNQGYPNPGYAPNGQPYAPNPSQPNLTAGQNDPSRPSFTVPQADRTDDERSSASETWTSTPRVGLATGPFSAAAGEFASSVAHNASTSAETTPAETTPAEPRPWGWLLAAVFACFFSMGLNLYLGWNFYDARLRYLDLLDSVRRRGTMKRSSLSSEY